LSVELVEQFENPVWCDRSSFNHLGHASLLFGYVIARERQMPKGVIAVCSGT
jgi:hypothetical protein